MERLDRKETTASIKRKFKTGSNMHLGNDILDQIYPSEEARRIRNLEPLHTLTIPTDGNDTSNGALKDNSTFDNAAGVSVYFRDLDQYLITYIRTADVVLGCVAWLTHKDILAALAAVPNGVGLIVQKENFLRPDINSKSSWKTKLRALYDALPVKLARHQFPVPLDRCSVSCDPKIDPVRCVGNYNADKHPAFPRMHHKFLVFCRSEPDHSQGAVYTEYWPRS